MAFPLRTAHVSPLPSITFFIGGGGDKELTKSHIMKNVWETFQEETAKEKAAESFYVGWYEEDATNTVSTKAAEKKFKNPRTKIYIVGHSYGGSSAILAAGKLGALGVRIELLITLDPVSALLPLARPRTIAHWINFDASLPVSKWNMSDWIAWAGGDWKWQIKNMPDDFITVACHHAEASKMLETSFVSNKLSGQTVTPWSVLIDKVKGG